MPTNAQSLNRDPSSEPGVCLHCGGELGRAWREEDGPFCCRGCRSVYALIHATGLDRYYDLRQGAQGPAAQLRPDSFVWLDKVLDENEAAANAPVHLSLDIQGVHCAACVWLLEELFQREDGAVDLRINPTLGKVDLTWDRTGGDLKHYLAEVEKFGYRFGPDLKNEPRRSRGLLARMAICIAIALNVMMFSISFYAGLSSKDGALFTFFGRLSLVLATVSVIVGGQIFFQSALAGLRRRVAHLDLPIALGMTLAYAGSVYGYFTRGPDGAYFDSLTIFVALMLVGRWAQEQILERNRNLLLASGGSEQIVVKRQRAGRLEATAATEIRRGDELWIAPGDLVPSAGILLRKEAELALDWITGEAEIRRFAPGETLPAGAFNAGQSGFTLSAVEDFADSRLDGLLRGGADAAASYRPAWWNRVSSAYVFAVLGLAALGFLLWLGQDPRRALEVSIAVLVVTCPCALGLATPLAEELIHSALRRSGIFLRRGGFLDRALRVRQIFLDKTGTLTLGRLVLDDPSRQALWRLPPERRQILWNLTARSRHPVSRGLAEALAETAGAPSAGSLDLKGEHIVELPGRGLQWRLGDNLYRLGRPDFARDGGEDPTGPEDPADAESTLFTVDGELAGAFRFEEAYRADAAQELAALRREGYALTLLSGDAVPKVHRAARRLGIPAERALGSLDPEAKAAIIRAADRQDSLMVGDGINDSPSFEAAFCSATPAVDRPVLPGKADFFYLGDGIAALRRALAAARRLRQVLRVNLAIAVAYNLLAVGLCYAGWVSPVVAAVLMPLSSVGVVSLTAFRLSGRRLAWIS